MCASRDLNHSQIGHSGVNMGNLCGKDDVPNITLSCVNTGMVSSCCKGDTSVGASSSPITLYKWMYSINTSSSNSNCGQQSDQQVYKNESLTWYTNYSQCHDDAMAKMGDVYASNTTAIHLFIFEWEVGSSSPPQLVYHRQMT